MCGLRWQINVLEIDSRAAIALIVSTIQQMQLVLIVDDDISMRLPMRETLEQAGFTVKEASDGNAGVSAIKRLRPNLELLDIMMPNLDGFGACAPLRELEGGEHVPVLMITGLEDSDSINRAYEVGATDFITKPITWPVLGHRVRNLFGRPPTDTAFMAHLQKRTSSGCWLRSLEAA